MHATTALLSFGAHFEEEDRGVNWAKDKVMFGIIGLHISKKEFNASTLRSIPRSDVVTYFDIDPMVKVRDERVPLAQIEVPGKLSGFVDDIMKAMVETGDRLAEMGCASLARFILTTLKSEPTAARLTTSLAAAFPHFRDDKLPACGGAELQTFKKALMLAAELRHHMRDKLPVLAFPDYASLPPYVTPAIVRLLVHRGVIKPKEGSSMDTLLSPEHAQAVVAAGIVALSEVGGLLREAGNGPSLAPLDVSFYLDAQGGKELRDKAAPRWDPGRNTTW